MAESKNANENVQDVLDMAWEDICMALDEDAMRTFFKKYKTVLQNAYAGKHQPKFQAMRKADLQRVLREQRKDPQVRMFFEQTLAKWTQEYDEARDAAQEDGCTMQLALLKGILASPFRQCPKICFQLYSIGGSKRAKQAVLAFAEELARPTAMETTEAALRRRKDEVARAKQQLEEERKVQSEELQNIKSKKRELQQAIEEEQQRLAKIRANVEAWRTVQATDAEDVLPPWEDAYENRGDGGLLSIMHPDMSFADVHLENHVLRRVADVDWKRGSVERFIPDAVERRFKFRETIIAHKEMLDEDDTYCGLINWYPEPNYQAPEKDYIHSRACQDITYIEVLVLPDCQNLGEVVQRLKTGLHIVDSNCRWAVTYATSAQTQETFLLRKDDFDIQGDVWRIRDAVVSLPVFRMEQRYMSSFPDGKRCFYQRLSLGKALRMVFLKTRDDIVKQCVRDAASWKRCKSQGISITREEWKHLSAVLDGVRTEELYDRVAAAARFSRHEAEAAVKAFLASADAEVLAEDLDSQVLTTHARQNEATRAQCEAAGRKSWEAGHQADVTEAKEELARLKKEMEVQAVLLKKKKEERAKVVTEYEAMQEELGKKEQISHDVECKVKAELACIQKDAAAAVSRMFVMAPMLASVQPAKLSAVAPEAAMQEQAQAAESAIACVKQDVTVQPPDQPCAQASDLVDLLMENLDVVGVKDSEISEALAVLAYACAVREVPWFFAGAQAVGIADAIACSLYGTMPLLIDLPRMYTAKAMQELANTEARVLILANAFASEWVDHIDRLVQLRKPLFFVAPFAEDLALLPRGTAAYGLPLLTDLVLDVRERGSWTFCGDAGQELYSEEVQRGSEAHMRLPLLRNLPMMGYERARYGDLLGLARGLSSAEEDGAMEYLLCGVPYAYLRGTLSAYRCDVQAKELLRDGGNAIEQRVAALFGDKVTAHA